MLTGEVQQPSTRPYRPELHGEAGCQLNVNTPESRLSGLVSWRGGPPGARLPSMHHRRGIRSARCARSFAAPSRQHAPAASLWSSPTRGTSQRCRSNDEIAVTQSRHSVPPTECRDYSAERCRGALERGGVPQRRRRPSSRNEPFVTLLPHIEMQPARKALCGKALCGKNRLRAPARSTASHSRGEPPAEHAHVGISMSMIVAWMDLPRSPEAMERHETCVSRSMCSSAPGL